MRWFRYVLETCGVHGVLKAAPQGSHTESPGLEHIQLCQCAGAMQTAFQTCCFPTARATASAGV